MWGSDRGQGLIEFALGLPIFLLASFYSFALIDAATTQEAVEAASRRAATALAGSNDDAQATGAAVATSWIRGQAVAVVIIPDGTTLRCSGDTIVVSVAAPGHLGFLIPGISRWASTQNAVIENPGASQLACVAAGR